MSLCIKRGLSLSLVAISSLMAAGENVEIKLDTPKSVYEKYIINGKGFALGENHNTLTWEETPGSITEKYGIFAGHSYYKDVEGNTLNFKGNDTNYISSLYGGYTAGGIAKKNTLNITGGNINMVVLGGKGNLEALENKIDISGGNFKNNYTEIYGGRSEEGEAKGNSALIDKATFTGSAGQGNTAIHGGYSQKGEANGNTATINGGTFKYIANIHGGYSGSASSTNDTATINGGTFEDSAYIYGGRSQKGEVSGNTATITGGTFEYSAYIRGGRSEQDKASGNTATITGGTFKDETIIHGGYSEQGEANGNTATISGGTFEDSASILGGYSNKGKASGNTATISGGTFKDLTYIYGAYSEQGEANGNTVTIKGGTFENKAYVYGGRSAKESATNNKVNLESDDLKLHGIYGGFLNAGDKDHFTGNTLNVRGKNIKAQYINKFEFLNFYIPKGFDITKDKMLDLTVGPDLTNSKIGVAMIEGGKLYKDDKVTLIQAGSDITYPKDMNNHKDNLMQAGISKVYTFKLDKDSKNKKLLAVVTEVDTSKPVDPKPTDPSKPSDPKPDNTMLPYPKNVVETTIGELGILSSSLDLASSMSLSTDSNGAFGSTSASNTRLKSGSHVDVKSFNAAVGLAKEFEGNQIGAFVEFGGGKYDSFNDFDKIDVRGNGKFKYIGLGIATKFSLPNSFYLSSSFKAGKIKSDYESDIPALTTPKYEATRSYYGAHLGLGKIVELNDVSNIDIYSKVFFNKLGSKEIEIVGDRILLKPTISLSAKFGARYNYTLNEKLDIYTGASYEREFKGEAKGYNITHDVDIASPSIKGSTYNAEIGAKLNTTNNLKLDFNLQGMTGKKRGVNGGIGIEWRF